MMKKYLTILNHSWVHYLWNDKILIVFLAFLLIQNVSAQKVYSTSITNYNYATNNGLNSVDQNESTFTELTANSGIILGIGANTSNVEVDFGHDLPANTTVYFKLEMEDDVLKSLLGGTLGSLLSSVLNVVLMGKQEFAVQARTATGTVVSEGFSNISTASNYNLIRVVQNANGHYYVAFTPTASFRRVRIYNVVGSLIGVNTERKMKVYDPYYFATPQGCGIPMFTNYDGSGISLNLLNLGGGVLDLENAIDGSASTYSRLSFGVISVLSTLSQNFYFDGLSTTNQSYTVTMTSPMSLIDISLLNNIRFRAYNGANQVQSIEIVSLMNQTQRNRFFAGLPTQINFTPSAPTDRLEVEYTSLLGVSVAQSIRIFEVSRNVAAPTFNASTSNSIICEGTNASLIGNSTIAGANIYWWANDSITTALDTTVSGSPFTTPALFSDTVYYMSTGKPGCNNLSVRVPVSVTVISGPLASNLFMPLDDTYCAIDTINLMATSNLGTAIRWYSSNSSTIPISSGITAGVYYQVNNGNLQLNGLTASSTPYTFYASVQDQTTGCWSTNSHWGSVQVTIIDAPAPTTQASQQRFCANINPTLADLQVDTTAILWYTSAQGGTALPVNTTLMDSTTYYAALLGAACESSTRLAIYVLIDDEDGPTTSAVTQTFCVIDSAQISDLQVTGSPLNWYNGNGSQLTTTTLLNDSTTYFATVNGAVCESSDTLAIRVYLNEEPAPTTANLVQYFCPNGGSTVADLQTNVSNVVWYDSLGNQLTSNTLITDSTSYFISQQGRLCESSNRLEIKAFFERLNTPTAALTDQIFCVQAGQLAPTVADLVTDSTNVVWYDAVAGGNLVTASTSLSDSTLYYAALVGTYCESVGRLAVRAIVDTISAPTTLARNQFFCRLDGATIDSIQVNGSSVVWYDSFGNLLNGSTVLTDNTNYYAVEVGANCQSSDSLIIHVLVNDLPAPTTTNATQYFCSVDQPTISDIVVNELNVIWYDVNGDRIPAGTALVDNTTYYGAMIGTTCESMDRLEVLVRFEEVLPPTTSDTLQTFCIAIGAAYPTIQDLAINQNNVNWYSVQTGGTEIPISTVLVNGGVYFASQEGSYCESQSRLQIRVVINEVDLTDVQLVGDTTNVCANDTIVYTVLSGMSGYSWTVNGGTIVAGGNSTDNDISIVWNNNGINTISVSFDNLNGCTISNSYSINVNNAHCSDLSVSKTVNNSNPFVGQEITFTITVTNSGANANGYVEIIEQIRSGFTYVSSTTTAGTYDPTTGIWALPSVAGNSTERLTIVVKVNNSGDYSNTVTIKDNNDPDPDNDVVTIVVIPKCLYVFNQFSPNNDGENDHFQIDCIEQYASNQVTVFNRYGQEVYHQKGYQNDWNGVSNVGGIVGKGEVVPTGTYFYVIKVDDKDFETSGWLYIVK